LEASFFPPLDPFVEPVNYEAEVEHRSHFMAAIYSIVVARLGPHASSHAGEIAGIIVDSKTLSSLALMTENSAQPGFGGSQLCPLVEKIGRIIRGRLHLNHLLEDDCT